jgi:hypothetical protein
VQLCMAVQGSQKRSLKKGAQPSASPSDAPHIAMCCLWTSCMRGPVNCRYDATVGVNDQAPDSWLGEIEVTHLSYEAVPLLRKPFFNEVISLVIVLLCSACLLRLNHRM